MFLKNLHRLLLVIITGLFKDEGGIFPKVAQDLVANN